MAEVLVGLGGNVGAVRRTLDRAFAAFCDGVEVRLLAHVIEGSPAVRCFDHAIALGTQSHPQQLSDRRLVVDDEHAERGRVHAAVSSRSAPTGTDRRMVNTAPGRSLRLAAVIVPCIASMKPREIASPRPVPARTWSPFCTR